jgi:hypothetical protein
MVQILKLEPWEVYCVELLCGTLVPRVGGVLGEEWVWFVVRETFDEAS